MKRISTIKQPLKSILSHCCREASSQLPYFDIGLLGSATIGAKTNHPSQTFLAVKERRSTNFDDGLLLNGSRHQAIFYGCFGRPFITRKCNCDAYWNRKDPSQTVTECVWTKKRKKIYREKFQVLDGTHGMPTTAISMRANFFQLPSWSWALVSLTQDIITLIVSWFLDRYRRWRITIDDCCSWRLLVDEGWAG